MGAEGAYDEEDEEEEEDAEEHGDIDGTDYEYGEGSEGGPLKGMLGALHASLTCHAGCITQLLNVHVGMLIMVHA